jgi:GNAT superfamily N-acetyltransferase
VGFSVARIASGTVDAIVLHHILSALDFHPVEANLRESFRVLAVGRTNGEVLELPGVSIASLGAAFQMFNAAFLSLPVVGQKELEARLEAAGAHFASRRQSWAFWICEDWLDRVARRALEKTCARLGLRLSTELPGMVAEALKPPRRPVPRLEFRRVDSQGTLDDFRAIGSVCFHVPTAWFSEVFDATVPAERPRFACWVAYHEGQPVGTAAAVRCEGSLGLYNIAIAPGFRRRGYAEALTRHAAETAGSATLVLQSTSAGMPLYARLGFRTVTRILVFNSNY